ncbi:hypothetical protein HK105_202685 [Polyrhizophydium stewartii]|uniref:Methyltransferase domain-containing protein n=1 Tax=Polyrhizophydium stewartii TaxID=2732419 RepID=A0ABR4NE68_9FUNG
MPKRTRPDDASSRASSADADPVSDASTAEPDDDQLEAPPVSIQPPPPPPAATVPADTPAAGIKAIRFVRTAFASLVPSRSSAHQAFKEGRVSLNGAAGAVAETHMLRAGDVVQLRRSAADLARATNEIKGLLVGFEDGHVAVVWKPAGVPVSGAEERTLELALPFGLAVPAATSAATSGDADALAAPVCIGHMSRSLAGWVVVAKTASARRALVAGDPAVDGLRASRDVVQDVLGGHPPASAGATQAIRRIHVVVCHGNAATIGAAIVDEPEPLRDGDSFEITTPVRGVPATTRVTVRAVTRTRNAPSGFLSTLEVESVAGFLRNQERIHLAGAGLPVIGIGSHAVEHRTARGKGLFQAVCRLHLVHPATGAEVVVDHPEPTKFKSLRDRDEAFWLRHAEELRAAAGDNGANGVAVTSDAAAAYIVGRRQFFGLEFIVTPNVLVPRAATETLVRAGLDWIAREGLEDGPRVLDLGTGSGCILVSLLHACPRAMGIGLDVSDEALIVARANAETHGVEGRAAWILGSFAKLADSLSARETAGLVPFHRPPLWHADVLDLIVANPPYMSPAKMRAFEQHSVTEPEIALVAGETGFECYEAIRDGLYGLVDRGDALDRPLCKVEVGRTRLVVEIGHAMASRVTRIFERAGRPSRAAGGGDDDSGGVGWAAGGGDDRTSSAGRAVWRGQWRREELLLDSRGLERALVFVSVGETA